MTRPTTFVWTDGTSIFTCDDKLVNTDDDKSMDATRIKQDNLQVTEKFDGTSEACWQLAVFSDVPLSSNIRWRERGLDPADVSVVDNLAGPP